MKGDIVDKEIYLFYEEGDKSVSLLSFESSHSFNFKEFFLSEKPNIIPNNQTAELITIEKCHLEYIQLNYYEGKFLNYDENRIFDFANYQ